MISRWVTTGLMLILWGVCAAHGAAAQGQMALSIGETKRVTFAQGAQALLLTNPAIAAMQSSSNLYIDLTGRSTGTGDVVALDDTGHEIMRVSLSVGIDLAQMQAAIDRLSRTGRVSLVAYDGAVVLNGVLRSDREADLIRAEVRQRAGAAMVIIDNLQRRAARPLVADDRRGADRRRDGGHARDAAGAYAGPPTARAQSRVGFLLR